ncbi:MAG: glycosyltransferase family 9 protein [Candidatus Firestonebacteria bacterium]
MQIFNIDYIKGIISGFFRSTKISPDEIKLSEIKNILVIRMHDPMGDVLISTAVIPNIKMALPQAKIDVVARPELSENEIFIGNKYINEIIIFDKKKLFFPFHFFRFIYVIRRKKYDMAIVLGSTSISFSSLIIAFLSKAPIRVGYEGGFFGKKSQTNGFLTTEVPYNASVKKHEIERNLDLLRYIGILIKTNELFMATLVDEDEWANEVYKKNNISLGPDIVIGMHLGANRLENRWPVDNFAKVSDYLIQKYKIKIVVFVGPSEKELVKSFLNRAKCSVFLLTDLSLRQLASVVKPLPLFICNDTGILHLAAALGTTTLAIFGPTDPDLWNPLGRQHFVIRDKSQLVENITSEQVISITEKILKFK